MAVDRKKLLSGGNATIAILAVLGVLVLLNLISDRRFKRWDWTGSQIYSLSDKTSKILAGLKTDVAATVLLQPNDPVYDEIHELLGNYQAVTPHIKVEYLDPSRQPARVEVIIKTFGLGRGDRTALVFSSGARHRHITLDELVELDMSMAEMGMNPRIKAFKGESAFTTAILSVSQDRQRTVYFLEGHGEVSIDDGAPGGISRFAEALKRQNLEVESADLKAGIPEDADLLVLAGPTIGFAPSEADALGAYVDGGGRLLALIDPVLSREGGTQELGIERMLITRGVAVGNDIVLDPARLLTFGSAESFGVSDFPQHIVTKDLAGTFVVFSLARSVAPIVPAPSGWNVTSLQRTSADGWAERDGRRGEVLLGLVQPRCGRGEEGRVGGRRGCAHDRPRQLAARTQSVHRGRHGARSAAERGRIPRGTGGADRHRAARAGAGATPDVPEPGAGRRTVHALRHAGSGDRSGRRRLALPAAIGLDQETNRLGASPMKRTLGNAPRR